RAHAVAGARNRAFPVPADVISPSPCDRDSAISNTLAGSQATPHVWLLRRATIAVVVTLIPTRLACCSAACSGSLDSATIRPPPRKCVVRNAPAGHEATKSTGVIGGKSSGATSGRGVP